MKNIVFFDIETVVETPDYENYPKKKVWAEKYCKDTQGLTEEQAYFEKGALHPEFAKIICISCCTNITNEVVSFYGDDEKLILNRFFERLNSQGPCTLGGHNIKSFDIPFVFRRSLINKIKPPQSFVIGHVKSRELDIVDTLDLRKQTGFIGSGLELICLCLGLPSPKGNISGKDVSKLYWENKESGKAIAEYCEGDVRATIQVYDTIQEILGEIQTKTSSNQSSDKISEKQVGYMMTLFSKAKITEEQRKKYLKEKYNVDSSKDLSKTDASEIIDQLQKNPEDILADIGESTQPKPPIVDDDLPF